MGTLKDILNEFEKKRTQFYGLLNGKTDDEKYQIIADWFRPCAEQILCNGYFLVNGKYIIDLGAIELYYHEEKENGIKDYIMYHIPERYQNPKTGVMKLEKKQHNQLPYFKLGSFNLHQSGVDVTFEKNNEYRASFLIRSYRVLEKEESLKDMTIKFDKCSTHIFDDMFYEGVFFNSEYPKIEWKECDTKGEIEESSCPRKNVTKREWKYDEKKGQYVINKIDEPDLRPWMFKRVGIKE